MDKFYFLCRRFLRHNLQMLLEQQWDENLTETFVRMLESTILEWVVQGLTRIGVTYMATT